jgi:hypothetical protein
MLDLRGVLERGRGGRRDWLCREGHRDRVWITEPAARRPTMLSRAADATGEFDRLTLRR